MTRLIIHARTPLAEDENDEAVYQIRDRGGKMIKI